MSVTSTKEDTRDVMEPVQRIKWFNVGVVISIHSAALYTFCFVLPHLMWQTLIWSKYNNRNIYLVIKQLQYPFPGNESIQY